ncbi:class I SAM-dependent methyltransferase [Undibacterium jejuense]|uniref:Class I SAM-dependent methyltransferase n=1 Tax=Undibacterium jejuense TaxID=1344949 RepID=A0A923HMF3_9BURK|nr:class I SAM-dependent methyltransferase [Undibacterium jejuense]MBC3862296.1 class I SAM-dependent methyltransferase [Undibacterium jejuense]
MTAISTHSSVERAAAADVLVSPWVQRFAHLLPTGQVLDVACGSGRHTHWLLASGYAVIALDKNPAMLPALSARGANVIQHDLEPDAETANWPFSDDMFSAIIVCNYLHRPLFPYLLASLKPDGVLIYETFAQGNAEFGKPSNPAFLLSPGELLEQMRSNAQVQMQVIAYEEGFVSKPKDAMVQRICARKAAFSSVFDHL